MKFLREDVFPVWEWPKVGDFILIHSSENNPEELVGFVTSVDYNKDKIVVYVKSKNKRYELKPLEGADFEIIENTHKLQDIDFYNDMCDFYDGKESVYKYPEIKYDFDASEALELTGCSGNMTSPYYPATRYEPAEGPEYDVPYDDSEIEEAYAEDMIRKFCKLNNLEYFDVRPGSPYVKLAKDFITYLDEVEGIPSLDSIYDYVVD